MQFLQILFANYFISCKKTQRKNEHNDLISRKNENNVIWQIIDIEEIFLFWQNKRKKKNLVTSRAFVHFESFMGHFVISWKCKDQNVIWQSFEVTL